MKKYATIAIISAFGVAAVFISLGFIEYGKVLGIEDLLRRQARQAGAAEPCHTCSIETAQERDAFVSYTIFGGIIGSFGLGMLVLKRHKANHQNAIVSSP